MWPFRKKPVAPSHATARRRAQRSATQDLHYWAATSLPSIQRMLSTDTEESLEDAEMYVVSLYEIVTELRRRKALENAPSPLPR